MSKITKIGKKANKQLQPNFNSNELDCKCKNPNCVQTLYSEDHIRLLQELRYALKEPIEITSAYRCATHNKSVGGAPKSRHVEGDATDLKIKDLNKLFELCKNIFNCIIRYDTFIHVDSRPRAAGEPLILDKRKRV